jgi:hypothetical protein
VANVLGVRCVSKIGLTLEGITSILFGPVFAVSVESDSTVGSASLAGMHGQQEDQMVVEDELTDQGDDADDQGGDHEEDIGGVEAEYMSDFSSFFTLITSCRSNTALKFELSAAAKSHWVESTLYHSVL